MENYNERCKKQGLNNDWGREVAQCIVNEFEKGKRGGFCSSEYIREKLGKIESFLQSLES